MTQKLPQPERYTTGFDPHVEVAGRAVQAKMKTRFAFRYIADN
jgi:hypothetical protein